MKIFFFVLIFIWFEFTLADTVSGLIFSLIFLLIKFSKINFKQKIDFKQLFQQVRLKFEKSKLENNKKSMLISLTESKTTTKSK